MLFEIVDALSTAGSNTEIRNAAEFPPAVLSMKLLRRTDTALSLVSIARTGEARSIVPERRACDVDVGEERRHTSTGTGPARLSCSRFDAREVVLESGVIDDDARGTGSTLG